MPCQGSANQIVPSSGKEIVVPRNTRSPFRGDRPKLLSVRVDRLRRIGRQRAGSGKEIRGVVFKASFVRVLHFVRDPDKRVGAEAEPQSRAFLKVPSGPTARRSPEATGEESPGWRRRAGHLRRSTSRAVGGEARPTRPRHLPACPFRACDRNDRSSRARARDEASGPSLLRRGARRGRAGTTLRRSDWR